MIIPHIYNLSFSIIAGIIQTEYKSIQFPVFRNVTPGINPILVLSQTYLHHTEV